MNVYLVLGASLSVCICATILKELHSSLGPLLSSFFCVFMCVQAIAAVIPVLKYLKNMGNDWRVLSEYIPYMMKALGISFVGTLSADLCSECGMKSAVFGINLAVKCMLLSLALPLVIRITETVSSMMTL